MNAFNPPPNFPFCPEQTDFLTFASADGFSAVYLDLIEGFSPNSEDKNETCIQLTNNNVYTATETVPVLVARFAAIKKLRYSHDRPLRENTTPPAQTTRPVPATSSSIWKTPGAKDASGDKG